MFKKLLYRIQEWRKLRRCDTLPEFESYVTEVLTTPELIGYWISNTMYYEDENPPTWFPIEQALKNKRGNCTEMAGLAVHAMRTLGHRAECLCVYGKDEHYESSGHAVCAFNDGKRRGIIDWSTVTYYKPFAPWPLVAIEVRPYWMAITWAWKSIKGEPIPSHNINL